MKKFISIANWLNESNNLNMEINKPIVFNLKDYPHLVDNIFNLIQIAYTHKGGYIKIKIPNDILKYPWDYWNGIDIDGDGIFNIVIFGKKTKYGIKIVGVGHDGSKVAKHRFLQLQHELFTTDNFYAEVSGVVSEIYIKQGIPVINNKEKVEQILGKKINWIGSIQNMLGDGWYEREIMDSVRQKIMIGNPNI